LAFPSVCKQSNKKCCRRLCRGLPADYAADYPRTTRGLCRRLSRRLPADYAADYAEAASCIMIRASCIVHRASFVVRRSSFVVRHSSFIIHHSSFIIHHSSFSTQHPALSLSFSMQHAAFSIQHAAFIIQPASFSISTQHSAFSFGLLSRKWLQPGSVISLVGRKWGILACTLPSESVNPSRNLTTVFLKWTLLPPPSPLNNVVSMLSATGPVGKVEFKPQLCFLGRVAGRELNTIKQTVVKFLVRRI